MRGYNHRALYRARKKAGLTQEQVAEIADIARPNYVNFENGRRIPGPKLLARFAAAVGVEPRDLIRLKPDQLKLRDLRDLANKSQTQTSTHLGYKGSTSWANIETGRASLPPERVEPLASLFGVTEDEILAAAARTKRAPRRRS